MNQDATKWIERLELQPHPEGGYFHETYRCRESIQAEDLPECFDGPHPFSTAIYFLLSGDQFSALHRIRSDEMWHFYAGSALTLHVIHKDGRYEQLKLGPGQFQSVAPAGCWFGASVDDADGYTLAGCTVAPGFVYDDFELGERAVLIEQFPQHQEIILKMTRS